MNTNTFITKILTEKLVGNEILLIKNITSFLTCDCCEEKLVMHDEISWVLNDYCVSCNTDSGWVRCCMCKKLTDTNYDEVRDGYVCWDGCDYEYEQVLLKELEKLL